jgi:hypothetical protein
MKLSAFAFLITGLAVGLLLPGQASSAQGVAPAAPGGGTWGYNPPVMPTMGSRYNPVASDYRFRPLPESEAERVRQHAQSYVRTPSVTPWGGYAGVPSVPRQAPRVSPQYHFRPMAPQPQNVLPQRQGYVYRPMQIEIPGQYVYRPLNPVKQAPRPSYRPPLPSVLPRYAGRPMVPGGYMYPGYPAYSPLPPMGLRARPQSRYVYGNPYWGPRFRPQPAGDRYVAHYSRPYQGPTPRYASRNRGMRPLPGYPQRYVWRPRGEPRPSRGYGPQPGYPGRYTAMQERPVWAPQGLPQAAAAPVMPNSGAAPRGMVQNRYGVDWYDGHSDGDGAWYKLVENNEWPRVTQHWTGE